MVPARPEEKPEETGPTLEEPRAEAGWDPDEAGVAPQRSTRGIEAFGSNMHGILSAERVHGSC
jgi:hypothetical protein